MKPVTIFQIHKLISQTSVYLLVLIIITRLLSKFDLVDQHQDSRMNGLFVNYIHLGLIYSIAIFYILSFYVFIHTSVSTIKDPAIKKLSLLYTFVYIFTLFSTILFETVIAHWL